MKKLLSFGLFLLLTLPLLIACKGETPAVTTQAPEAPAPVTELSLSINGNDLSGYSIVYAKSPYDKRTARNFTTEYDFYKLIATSLAEKIYNQTGVVLTVTEDSKAQVSDLEILVGPTNRTESKALDKLDVYDAYCKVVGSKLVIGGGYDATAYTGNLKQTDCFASTYHAWDAAESYLAECLQAGVTTVDFPNGCDFSTQVDLITVACIGDSITEGFASSNWELYSYPAVLGRILWQDHLIVNLGNSGRTMRDDLSNAYMGTTQYNAMRRYAKKWDYALIMLGTNDSYFDRTWTSADDTAYFESFHKIVKGITSTNSDVQVVVMNCPVYYGNEGSGSPHVRAIQNQLPAQLTEKGIASSFFDMHAYTEKYVGRSNFPDLLHPNDLGYATMAKGVSQMLTALKDGTYTYTLPEVEDEKSLPTPTRSVVAAGSVNLLPQDLSTVYPADSAAYSSWYMAGTPYLYMDLNRFGGMTVTNIEMPVASVQKGATYTVSVVKYDHPRVTETLATYRLTAPAACSSGWLGFDGLSIDVPQGYTLAFGNASDSIVPLYIPSATTGYSFYGCNNNSVNPGATLCFNVYGKTTD